MADGFVFDRGSSVGSLDFGDDIDTDSALDQINAARSAEQPGLDEDAFLGAFRAAVADAEEYTDGHIAPLRAAATRYYRGDLFGNEEEGRSKVVMTEVRDAVLGIIPSLLRIFTGSEHPVEFVPQNEASVGLAQQQTDYVSYVFHNDNPGFMILHSMIKDALVRKTGIVKWRWSEDVSVTETCFTGLHLEQIAILQQDQTVEIVDINPQHDPVELYQAAPIDPHSDVALLQHGLNQAPATSLDATQAMPQQAMPQQMTNAVQPVQMQQPPAPALFDCRIRRRIKAKRCIVESVPPEEWLINRDARNANDERGYNFQGHRCSKTVSDIVSMGYDREEVEQHADGADPSEWSLEKQARNPAAFGLSGTYDTPDDSMRRCAFIEAYMRIDRDGDGIAELHKIHAIGNAYHILSDEVIDEAPFAVFCPDPEPHMVIGSSVADQTMDLQLIKSNMMRGTLDSAAAALHPRTVIVEGQVNVDDAMNTEQGAIIRTRQIGAVQELTKPFIGTQMMPLFAYVDQTKQRRTGLNEASQGVSPDTGAGMSTTPAAITALVTGAQERIEMYARIMSEALRRMYRGIAKTLRENQDQPRMIKLRGQWVPCDPRTWVGDLECIPNIAMGQGTDQDRLQKLGMILQEQKTIIQQLGPVNPICGIDRYRATFAQIVALAGFKDASKYIGEVTPQFMQQLQQSSQNKPPQAADIIAQAEMMKAQHEIQLKDRKFAQEQLEAALADERAREATRMDMAVRLAEIEAKYPGQNPNMALIDSLLQHEQQMAEVQSAHVASLHQNITAAQAQVQSAAVKAAAPGPQQAPQPGQV